MEAQSKVEHTSSILCAHQHSGNSCLKGELFRGSLLSYRDHAVQKCLWHYAPSMENSSKILSFVFKDFISGNPKQSLNTKSKSISFPSLEILYLTMERKEDRVRAQLGLQEKISGHRKKGEGKY